MSLWTLVCKLMGLEQEMSLPWQGQHQIFDLHIASALIGEGRRALQTAA